MRKLTDEDLQVIARWRARTADYWLRKTRAHKAGEEFNEPLPMKTERERLAFSHMYKR